MIGVRKVAFDAISCNFVATQIDDNSVKGGNIDFEPQRDRPSWGWCESIGWATSSADGWFKFENEARVDKLIDEARDGSSRNACCLRNA